MADDLNPGEFSALLRACHEISSTFPDGVAFIGGIAVYLHSINHTESAPFAEFTHDADFYISIADMSDLRDMEEVTPNRRLSKHQLRKDGFEFDIYTERHSALALPYDQVIAHSITYERLRVAGLEHLLVLKLEAYRDRMSSAKGAKDAKDLIRIAIIASSSSTKFEPHIADPYLDDRHFDLLERIARGPDFLSLARGNAKQAKDLRKMFTKLLERLSAEHRGAK